MTWNRAELKHMAKEDIRRSKPSALLVALVSIIISLVLDFLSGKISGAYDNAIRAMEALMAGDWYYIPATVNPGFMGSLLNVAIYVISLVVGVGFTIYALNLSRQRPAGFGNLFDGFGIFFRILWLNILLGFFVFVWTLLFIIPGIIAAYRYRMAVYIMLDNPQMSCLECIRASKELMRGHKWELFVLDLSFILWYLICIIPVFYIWVTPYSTLTYVHYYNALSGGRFETEAPPAYGYGNERRERDPWDPER